MLPQASIEPTWGLQKSMLCTGALLRVERLPAWQTRLAAWMRPAAWVQQRQERRLRVSVRKPCLVSDKNCAPEPLVHSVLSAQRHNLLGDTKGYKQTQIDSIGGQTVLYLPKGAIIAVSMLLPISQFVAMPASLLLMPVQL